VDVVQFHAFFMPFLKPSQDMYDFFMLLATVVLIALIVGLFAPKKVVFWKKETATRKDVLKWYLSSFLAFVIIAGEINPNKPMPSETVVAPTSKETKPEIQLTQAQKDSILEAQKKAQAIEDANREVAELEAKAAQRREKADKCFSAWDGSHMELVRTVKAGMNDPSSFEHVKTVYAVSETGIVTVRMSFRGKNGFGALMLKAVEAETNLDCEVLSVKWLE
jgi:hypothetical protein